MSGSYQSAKGVSPFGADGDRAALLDVVAPRGSAGVGQDEGDVTGDASLAGEAQVGEVVGVAEVLALDCGERGEVLFACDNLDAAEAAVGSAEARTGYADAGAAGGVEDRFTDGGIDDYVEWKDG